MDGISSMILHESYISTMAIKVCLIKYVKLEGIYCLISQCSTLVSCSDLLFFLLKLRVPFTTQIADIIIIYYTATSDVTSDRATIDDIRKLQNSQNDCTI